MKAYKKGRIVENIEISKNIYKMVIDVNLSAAPGQFFMFRTKSFRNEPILSRPFGVCDESCGSLTLLYQVVGEGTDIMASLTPEHEVQLLGPLGNGFNLENSTNRKIAVVAGGIGIAPLLSLVKKLESKVDFYAGFTEDTYFIDEFRPHVDKITCASFKKDGIFVTELFDPNDYDLIYACGPNGMLKSIHEKNTSAELQISMEAHMACGIGACLGCTVESSDGEFLRVCKDGPVFNSKEVFS